VNEDEPILPNPQDEQAYRVAYLLAGFIKDSLTEAEREELDEWICASMDNQRLFERLIDPKNLDEWVKYKKDYPVQGRVEEIKKKIEFEPERKKPVVRSLLPYLAAAIIILGLILTIYHYQKAAIPKDTIAAVKAMDIAPGTNRATLTLSNGTVVVLDSVKKGSIGTEGNVEVSKKDDEMIVYKTTNAATQFSGIEYNVLTTPRGGQFAVSLPDGSKVWLNAVSSLKYPTVFKNDQRIVELNGEAYFEVSKDASRPFVVVSGGTNVQVLGTHFNINAYTDEPQIKVTLTEGKVRVNEATVLKPNQQAVIEKSGQVKTIEADLETDLAWKQQLFIFKATPLDIVMRQVARWYDADIDYQAQTAEHFNFSIPRDVPVSKLLHLMEGTGRVHFKIENKKITVMK
jgi:transmembrane sensor